MLGSSCVGILVRDEQIFDLKDVWLNLLSARIQFAAESLSETSSELFGWREKLLLKHGVHPESGKFARDTAPFLQLNELGQIYYLAALLKFPLAKSLDISRKAFAQACQLDLSQSLIARVDWLSKAQKLKLPLQIETSSDLQTSIKCFLERADVSAKICLREDVEVIDYLDLRDEDLSEIELREASTDNNIKKKFILKSDGGSRGNPGPAAYGFELMDERGSIIYEGSGYIGVATNNQAEYRSLIAGLEHLCQLGAEQISIQMDSQLVVKQILGEYKVKKPELQKLNLQAQSLLKSFTWKIEHIPRALNKNADRLCNLALDKAMS